MNVFTIMERRLNQKIDSYIRIFKTSVCSHIQDTNTFEDNKEEQIKLIDFIYQYSNFELNKDDFMKRKRIKSTIPSYERCCAKRANGEQCTRRKRDEFQYCGTHTKGTPHGVISDEPNNNTTKIEVSAIDIKGIIYYLDDDNNVYDTEDVISNKQNPRIIAKYKKSDDVYSIPEFNI
jgi:hypothetical protein